MSFAGSVSAMIISLRNNKRPKITMYDKKELRFNHHKMDIHAPDTEFTIEQRESIIKTSKANNRKDILRMTIVFGVVVLAALLIVFCT